MQAIECIESSQYCCHCCTQQGNHDTAGRNPNKLCPGCYTAVTLGGVRIVKNTDTKTGWSCGCYDYDGYMDYCKKHSVNNPPPIGTVQVPVPSYVCNMNGCSEKRDPKYKYCHSCFVSSRCATDGCKRTCGQKTNGTWTKYCWACWQNMKK